MKKGGPKTAPVRIKSRRRSAATLPVPDREGDLVGPVDLVFGAFVISVPFPHKPCHARFRWWRTLGSVGVANYTALVMGGGNTINFVIFDLQ